MVFSSLLPPGWLRYNWYQYSTRLHIVNSVYILIKTYYVNIVEFLLGVTRSSIPYVCTKFTIYGYELFFRFYHFNNTRSRGY